MHFFRSPLYVYTKVDVNYNKINLWGLLINYVKIYSIPYLLERDDNFFFLISQYSLSLLIDQTIMLFSKMLSILNFLLFFTGWHN